jgi:hypothetical protein
MALLLLRRTAEKLDEAKLRAELESVSTSHPWYKNNILRCEEIGLKLDAFLRLCLNSLNERKM